MAGDWTREPFFLGDFMAASSKRGAKGLIDGRLAPLPRTPNAVSSEDGTPERFAVEPLSGSADEIEAAVEATGGVINTETDDYIHATYTSSVFRFVDDVELRREGTKWHIRSASRVGHSDLGANRKRVNAIREALQTGMSDT